MDLNVVTKFALIVNTAYGIQPTDLTNRVGQTIVAGPFSYTCITSIYACDLATDANPQRGNNRVSIGLILQDPASGDLVIAVRGTEGIWEWIHDAQLLMVPCPIPGATGHTEDGFTAMYNSLNIQAQTGSSSIVQGLNKNELTFPRPVASITICGHSLGGALATLLSLDVAINTSFKSATVYTYASPRTGGPAFVNLYNHVLPNTVRIANRMDLVPKLPLPPLYDHVTGLYELNSIQLGLPPTVLVKPNIPCEHYLSSYLFLLSQLTGGNLQLEAQCVPPAGMSLAQMMQAV